MYKHIFRNQDPDVFESHVQICHTQAWVWCRRVTNPERAMEQMGCRKHSQREAQEYQGIEFDMASVILTILFCMILILT